MLEAEYPEQIELIAKLRSFSRAVTFPDGETRDLDFHFADESILEIFEFEFMAGDRQALSTPYSVVVSQSFAQRHFGLQSAVGAILELNNTPLTVTGVFEDPPANTHLAFNMAVSSDTGRRVFNDSFMNGEPWILFQDTRTYIRLYPGVNVSELVRDLERFVDRYIPDDERLLAQQTGFRLDLQPVRQIHISPREGGFDGVDNSVSTTLVSLVVFAATIITLAFVNYLFLSVSRLMRRSREIAIRRVVCASRKDLVKQFVGESGLVMCLSLLVAVPLVYIAFPIYSGYVGISLSVREIPFAGMMAVAFVLLTVMSLIAGGFALYVVSGEKGEDLKGGASKSVRGLRLSMAGSIIQVTLSLMLMILSSSIYLHTRHLYQSDLGFDHDGLIIVDLKRSPSSNSPFNYMQLLDELDGDLASGLTATTFHPARTVGFLTWNSSGRAPDESTATGYVIVDDRSIETYGLQLLAGRALSSDNPADVMPSFSAPEGGYNAVITRYASTAFGFSRPEDALGQTIESVAGAFTIIGVVDNFRLSSLQADQGAPGVILASSRPMQYINVRYEVHQEADVIRWVEGVIRDAAVDSNFEYDLYRDVEAATIEARAAGVSVAALSSTATSLLITVLGFIAVVLLISSLRNSSTAVRQMLGATPMQSIAPMFRDFCVVLLVSMILSIASIFFIERLVSQSLGVADISVWVYVALSFVMCVCFAGIGAIVTLVHNRRVLGLLFAVER